MMIFDLVGHFIVGFLHPYPYRRPQELRKIKETDFEYQSYEYIYMYIYGTIAVRTSCHVSRSWPGDQDVNNTAIYYCKHSRANEGVETEYLKISVEMHVC